MDTVPRFSPAAVICLTLLIVVAVNGGLILALRRGGTQRQVDLLKRAAKAARNPWAEQDQTMSELRERVSQLESDRGEPPEPDG
jgi:hypothetical protein